jgi:tetratricopeptide (TPR) repeat protein
MKLVLKAAVIVQLIISFTISAYAQYDEEQLQRELERLEEDGSQSIGSVRELLNSLAWLYRVQGKYAEAESLYERLLKIIEKDLDPDVVNYLWSEYTICQNNLAELYRVQGKYAEAESLYERSLKIIEKDLDPRFPDVVHPLWLEYSICQNNLAELYRVQGKYAEAESLYERSLKIRENVFGPEHPDVAQSLNNLAILYNDQGKYAEAERLFKRSLKIYEKALGPEHLDVATVCENMANLYKQIGKKDEAVILETRVRKIRCTIPGEFLEPEDSIFSGEFYSYQAKYYSMVYTALKEAYKRDVRVRVLVLPSFSPEYAVGIRENSGTFTIFRLSPVKQLWRYKILEDLKAGRGGKVVETYIEGDKKRRKVISAEERIAKIEAEYPKDFRDVEIKRCEVQINSDLAKSIIEIWEKMLLQTRYVKKNGLGLDGATYHFSMLSMSAMNVLAGKTWSPSAKSKTGKLVKISYWMEKMCMTDNNKLEKELKNHVEELKYCL